MRGRPPTKTLTPDQERAASAFVEGAEAPGAGSGPARPPHPERAAPPPAARPVARPVARPAGDGAGERPWEAAHVRDDVVKGYALRLPEPLYLRLKWVAERTGRSMNGVCRDAIEAEIERYTGEEAS